MSVLLSELEVSKATIKRDLAYMRTRLRAPIVWKSAVQGYCYTDFDPDIARFSLPGLWFSSSELHALLTMDHLLEQIQPGFLELQLQPLKGRIRNLLARDDHAVEEIIRRIRVFHGTIPSVNKEIFQSVASAVLNRCQIFACHLHRGTDESVERFISPQRLVYYGESWYLDGWCHLREGLRTFKLFNLTRVELTDLDAIDMDESVLDAELKSGFGIFVGKATQNAKLRFSASMSRWVMHETWHPDQHADMDDENRLELTVPYSNDPELIARILRYGPDVEVMEPAELREKVAGRLLEACSIYSG